MDKDKFVDEILSQATDRIEQREAVPGMPSEGPYPATVGEVADELAEFIWQLDRSVTIGLALELTTRLNVSPTVSRDGADDTPVQEGVAYNPGQLLARILDADRDERLKLCAVMIDNAGTAIRCEGMDHEGDLSRLRKTYYQLTVERIHMQRLIMWLSMHQGISESVIEFAQNVTDNPKADYTRMALAEKINEWARMAKTTQARISEIQEALPNDADGSGYGTADIYGPANTGDTPD